MPTPNPARIADSEKITVNLGPVDLGRIDLLVQEGFYANRADFIRTAIRNQLGTEADAVARSVERHRLDLGLRTITRDELEAAEARGEKLVIRVVGLARLDPDIPAELACRTIGRLSVLGTLQAPAELRRALGDRIG